MNISWDDARLFLAVAEAGSLSAAARKLQMTQPTVSRRLAELEAVLGEPLFDRGVAGAALTAYGAGLLEPAQRMADWAAELTRAAERRHAPAGVVRMTAPPGVAHAFLAPFAAAISLSTPSIQLHVVSTVRPLDLIRREADLALRLGAPADETSVASVDLELRAFASEQYAARVAGKTDPADLAWIGWAPPFDDLSPNSVLRRRIPGWRPSFASDDYLVQIRACELGLGAMLLPREHPHFGRRPPLCALKVDLPPVRRPLVLLCPRSARAIPRVRAVLELLVESLRAWRPPKGRAARR
ncbi:LysR family transcriptional regulator [Sorangium sp. So ce296]|uniref:LysR family transcriptional regulator n=1 Tax=Sorangium sp. So ce296 TaxID=3133296 RepID=UPI003F5EF7C3